MLHWPSGTFNQYQPESGIMQIGVYKQYNNLEIYKQFFSSD